MGRGINSNLGIYCFMCFYSRCVSSAVLPGARFSEYQSQLEAYLLYFSMSMPSNPESSEVTSAALAIVIFMGKSSLYGSRTSGWCSFSMFMAISRCFLEFWVERIGILITLNSWSSLLNAVALII